MSDNLLEIEKLNVDYLLDRGEFRAVKDVSFNIGRGEIFGLAGESGCGKSTIAYAITRLSKAPAWISGGSIRMDGRDLLKIPERELQKIRWKRIGMVFQSAMNSLNPLMRVEAQFHDVLYRHTGCSRQESRARGEEMFRLVGIPPQRISDYPHQFSGGMRQRIVIAICLALHPKLLIMDEPTTALDVVVQREILQRIDRLRKELGFSVLFITHDLSLMVQVSDRIGVMLEGELIEVNDAQTIYRSPQHPYTQRLWASMPRLHGEQIRQGAS